MADPGDSNWGNSAVQSHHHEIAPKDIHTITAEIHTNLLQTTDSNLRESTIHDVLIYLTDPATNIDHWFCDSDERILVATISLLGFAFSDDMPILRAHRSRLAEVLGGCHKCVREYHIQLIRLRRLLQDDLQFGVEVADELLNCITSWNVDRLTTFLTSVSQNLEKIENPRPRDISYAFVSIFECLCAPRMLLDPDHKPLFDICKKVFFYVQTPQSPGIRPPELLPGFISFLFGTDPEFYIFVRTSVARMITKKQTTDESSFDIMLCNAIDDIVSDIQSNPRTQAKMRLFWYNFDFLLNILEPSVLKQKLAGREFDILRFLTNSILQSPKESLPATLSVLGSVIEKLGPETWDVFSPIKVNALVMAIVRNPYFVKPETWIPKPAESELDFPQKTSDSLNWIIPLLKSCDKTDLQKCSQQILPKIMGLAAHFKSKQEEEPIFSKALDIFILCLKFEPRSSRLPFLFQVERLVKQDTKLLCYQYADNLLDACKRFKDIDLDVFQKTYDIIYYSISLDVIAGTPEFQALKNSNSYEGEIPPSGTKSLWEKLNNAFPINTDISIPVLRALKHITFIARPPPKKPEEVLVVPKGELSLSAISNAVESMRLIGLYDSENLAPVLKDKKALLSIFLCMFSADENVNQSAVDVLCQALDADDRLSALTGVLNFDFKVTLSVLTEAIDFVNVIGIFAPCPKLIKVSQDVSQCLFGASFGVFAKHKDELSSGSENEFLLYWVKLWTFLERTFAKTPKWSSSFKTDFMMEFLRDLIDFSGGLVEYFSLVESLIPPLTQEQIQKLQEHSINKNDSKTPKSISGLLLEPVIVCLIQMCELLRLRDEALIRSCFGVIMAVLELMKRFNISPSDELVQVFTKLASNAVRFENNLTNDQKTSLLVASGSFTIEEAERVMGGRATPDADDDDDILEESVVHRSVAASGASGIISKTDASGKQTSLLDFSKANGQSGTKTGSSFQKPPSSSAYTVGLSAPKASMLDAVRQSLNAKKSIPSANISKREIHPARPPGFNSNSMFARKAAAAAAFGSSRSNRSSPNKDGHSSSDDDDSENDDNEDGLFAQKPQAPHKLRNIEKQTTTSLGVGFSRGRISRDTISEKEREERNMRARLQVDLDPLYRKILSWDYHANLDYPSVLNKDGTSSPDDKQQYKAVSSTFKTVTEYVNTFEPLLMLECWQGIIKSKEENMEKPFKVWVGSKTLVGNGIYEIRVSVPTKAFSQTKMGDSDLILLSYSPQPSVDAIYPNKDIPYCFAKVKEIKNSGPENTEIAIRVDEPPLKMHTSLTLNTELHVLRVTSLTTIEREYSSLKALAYYNLKDKILAAEPSESPEPRNDVLTQITKTYNVNESQARAIVCSLNTEGVSLIQGPPGTGKTKTILGIIGSFLTDPRPGAPPPANKPSKEPVTPDKIRRIIICAPSNAAVDELVLRLKDGIQGYDGRTFKPSVVRLGRSDAINSNVQEFTLEELVDRKLSALDKEAKNVYDGKLRETQNEQLAERETLRKNLANCQASQEMEILRSKIADLTRKIKDTGHELDRQRENIKVNIRKRDIERRKYQTSIIQAANVVCTTLSGSAHNVLLSLGMYFETVVIDEAAQSVELSSLIPLKYGCKQCIMVGDPNQLPPTVLSLEAAKFKYNESLFVRMFKNFPNRVHMLNTQFRMHPEISQFPSREFYRDKLKDGPENHMKTRRVWHTAKIFGPYRFFDVSGQQEQSKGTKSLFNRHEAAFALNLYSILKRHFGREFLAGKIGIISPYKSQVGLLKKTFINALGNNIIKEIDFNTIDGFQGQEKDIIIMSCVRAQPDAKGVGFLGDTRRMNVAVTRAKSSLWILGNEKSLIGNPVWKRLLDDAKKRGLFTHGTPRLFEDEKINHEVKKAARLLPAEGSNGNASNGYSGGNKPSKQVQKSTKVPPPPSYPQPPKPSQSNSSHFSRRDSSDYEPTASFTKRKTPSPSNGDDNDSYSPNYSKRPRYSRDEDKFPANQTSNDKTQSNENPRRSVNSSNELVNPSSTSGNVSSNTSPRKISPKKTIPETTSPSKAQSDTNVHRQQQPQQIPQAPHAHYMHQQHTTTSQSEAESQKKVTFRRRPPSVFVKRPPGRR